MSGHIAWAFKRTVSAALGQQSSDSGTVLTNAGLSPRGHPSEFGGLASWNHVKPMNNGARWDH